MNIGMGARLRRIAKVVACLCAIELILPGGTLIVLGYLLASRPHVSEAAEGEGPLRVLRDLRGLISANTRAGNSNRSEGDHPRGR